GEAAAPPPGMDRQPVEAPPPSVPACDQGADDRAIGLGQQQRIRVRRQESLHRAGVIGWRGPALGEPPELEDRADVLGRSAPHRPRAPIRVRHRSVLSAGLTGDHLVTYSPSMDEVFKALADPTRRALLDDLFEEDGQTLGALEAGLPMTRFG